MQVIIKNESEVKEKKYPYIGIVPIDNGDIVLFIKKNEGFSLRYPSGLHYSDDWREEIFQPFSGEIILKNY